MFRFSILLLSMFFVAQAAPALDLKLGRTEITRASVVAAMNAIRADHQLPPLRDDDRLDAAADDRMRDMENNGYWGHVSPDGRSPFVWLPIHGYLYSNAGENLASGFETTEVLLASWMESEGHRENILSIVFRDCGVAIIDGSTLGRASGRSVVVLFARARAE
ncbi:MAG TPA: CAP domain-containing protein [Thermoanaerobaculia bacterium]|nr:CAP domain-containing protein [Thermoanaerobaculia bacterium]